MMDEARVDSDARSLESVVVLLGLSRALERGHILSSEV